MVTAVRAGLPAGWTLGPVVIAQQARVALADEAGALLGARLVAMLIGERPGLSSPDSLGLYLTWKPAVGRHGRRAQLHLEHPTRRPRARGRRRPLLVAGAGGAIPSR